MPSPSGYAQRREGVTVVPLLGGVGAARIEAQCILLKAGFNPGTVDGIFGPRSRSAARALQALADNFLRRRARGRRPARPAHLALAPLDGPLHMI